MYVTTVGFITPVLCYTLFIILGVFYNTHDVSTVVSATIFKWLVVIILTD